MITAEEVEKLADELITPFFRRGNENQAEAQLRRRRMCDDAATLLRQLLKERDEALEERDTALTDTHDRTADAIKEARSKALDEACDAWRYSEEKDDVGRLILSLKDTPAAAKDK